MASYSISTSHRSPERKLNRIHLRRALESASSFHSGLCGMATLGRASSYLLPHSTPLQIFCLRGLAARRASTRNRSRACATYIQITHLFLACHLLPLAKPVALIIVRLFCICVQIHRTSAVPFALSSSLLQSCPYRVSRCERALCADTSEEVLSPMEQVFLWTNLGENYKLKSKLSITQNPQLLPLTS